MENWSVATSKRCVVVFRENHSIAHRFGQMNLPIFMFFQDRFTKHSFTLSRETRLVHNIGIVLGFFWGLFHGPCLQFMWSATRLNYSYPSSASDDITISILLVHVAKFAGQTRRRQRLDLGLLQCKSNAIWRTLRLLMTRKSPATSIEYFAVSMFSMVPSVGYSS